MKKNIIRIEMLLLSVLKKEDSYGYAITNAIRNITHGDIDVKVGTAYPLMYALVNNGCLTTYTKKGEKGRERIYYHITEKGLKHLDDLIVEYRGFEYNINKLIQRNNGQ